MKQISMKKVLLTVLLLALALALCGCAGGKDQTFPTTEPTQKSALDAVPTLLPTDAPEHTDAPIFVPQEVSQYAGASPVPLDPVDMPTPTPRPELTFTYVKTQVEQLGIQFEIPGNFVRDDSVSGTVIFTDPNTLDNVNATITLKLASVSSDHKLDNVKNDIQNELALLGQYNFSDWSTTDPTARKMLGKDGFYSDYRGVLLDGTIVRGRVQMALMDNNLLLTMEYRAPGWFNSSYKNVFDHIRSTMSIIGSEQQ
ncbi:MAG: hypothetical protein IKT57_08230 [Clostridia bacterium]|nr:hypothetical protein [Clostridia bacterium]